MNQTRLVKPQTLQVEEETLTGTYGKFMAEPFEKGFGTTLGNSLRRVLISSLQGAAITSVKASGVLHEFSPVPGVTEDMTEVILNLKGVRFKVHGSEPRRVRIVQKGEGVIRAKDILVDHAMEILNPEHHIATCSKDTNLEMDMVVKVGRGYVPADRNRESAPIGTIPIDAIFSPIVKVNFRTENARVGEATDYDKVTLEVWTDGSVNPQDAVAHAAMILKDQLSIFTGDEVEEPVVDEAAAEREQIDERLYRAMEEFELSVRSSNCLKNAGIRLVGELVIRTEAELLATQNFGRKSLTEIKDLLSDLGLTLGMKLDNFPAGPQK